MDPGQFDLVVVANRLPVDATVDDDGTVVWQRSPGGLVAALEPVLGSSNGAWVGWPGAADLNLEPFEADGISLVPVPVSESEIAEYYEGFSNATIWPLYHDVITPPEYHREWAEAYRTVNRRFAIAAARAAAPQATVWIHDYQLQLVPRMLRSLRPDVRVGFFLHIPFPGVDLFSQLPWRREILEGVLGADLIGFQRAADASNFRRAVRRLTGLPTHGTTILVTSPSAPPRAVRALPFPISIDFDAIDATARRADIQQRALAIREDLGNPEIVFLGADRLDYTKGIRHRLKAFGELVASGELAVPGAILVQVASPTRDNVIAYQELRDEVETTVGRINGDFGTLTQVAVQYLHQVQPFDEMVA
ncbi:MAG: trehalose-6-phosphate synthase, partial [Bifidobacteriaceae bacterium]|nr:trehalose-6-phosphate synthase [Bifidobacteriaceae bacterium]